jgi:hypothetical protein
MTPRDAKDMAASVMTARSMTLMSARDAMAWAATAMMAKAAMARAVTAMTAPANPHPHFYPLVPDRELLVLGSRDTNVAIATVHFPLYWECAGELSMLRTRGFSLPWPIF